MIVFYILGYFYQNKRNSYASLNENKKAARLMEEIKVWVGPVVLYSISNATCAGLSRPPGGVLNASQNFRLFFK